MRNEAVVGEAGWLLSDGLGGGGGVRVGMAFFFFSPSWWTEKNP